MTADTHHWKDDLPLLPDPIDGTPAASAHTPEAQVLLRRLQVDEHLSQPDAPTKRSVPRWSLATVAAAVVALVVVFAPFGGGQTAAEAVANASALLDASDSGRILENRISVRDGRTETANSVYEWSGDREHFATTATGSIWASDEPIHTPGSFAAIDIGAESWMNYENEGFTPAEKFPVGDEDESDPITRIADAAVDLMACDDASPNPGLTSYCATTNSPDIVNPILGWSPTTITSADPVTIRVDLHTDTGMVAGVQFSATNVVHYRPAELPAEAPWPEQWTLQSVDIEHIYEALGEPITIERP